MEWQKVATEILDRIRGFRADNSDWKTAKESTEANVWYKTSTDWKGNIYKTEGILEADPETVFHYINPTTPDSPRNKWDKHIKERQILEQPQTNVFVMRTVTHGAVGGLVSARDFVDVVLVEKNDQFLATAAKSISYPDAPASSDCVRGTNYPSAIICGRIDGSPDKTLLTTYIQSDIGGMLPQSIVEQALPSSQLGFVAALTQALKEGGHWKG
jgi:hypothetical protein